MCEDCVAIGDINGNTVYVFNKTGMLGKIDTSLVISQIEVASNGAVVAVLEDNEANYINMYSKEGTKIYSIKTTVSGDGYPLDVSISNDATKLIASYVYVSGEDIKTNVVFYNFSAKKFFSTLCFNNAINLNFTILNNNLGFNT